MAQAPEALSTATPVPISSGERDIQRSALRDLVALSAESAAAEVQIEQFHHTQLQQAERQLKKALEEIEQRVAQQKEEAAAEYQNRTGHAVQQHAQAMAELKKFDASVRQRIEYETDSVGQD